MSLLNTRPVFTKYKIILVLHWAQQIFLQIQQCMKKKISKSQLYEMPEKILNGKTLLLWRASFIIREEKKSKYITGMPDMTLQDVLQSQQKANCKNKQSFVPLVYIKRYYCSTSCRNMLERPMGSTLLSIVRSVLLFFLKFSFLFRCCFHWLRPRPEWAYSPLPHMSKNCEISSFLLGSVIIRAQNVAIMGQCKAL